TGWRARRRGSSAGWRSWRGGEQGTRFAPSSPDDRGGRSHPQPGGAMKLRTLEDLFLAELRDVYDAQRQLGQALPRLARTAANDELRGAFDQHLGETEGQVERLERVFELVGYKAKGKTCEAMKGLVAEGKDVIGDIDDPAVGDAALIACAQK